MQNLRYPVTMQTSGVTTKEKQSQNQLPIKLGRTDKRINGEKYSVLQHSLQTTVESRLAS